MSRIFYRILRPYRLLKRWLKFQRQIYSIPREDRPAFWEVQQQMEIAKAHMKHDLGKRIYGNFQSQQNQKEFDGLWTFDE